LSAGLNIFDGSIGAPPEGDPQTRQVGSLQDDALKAHAHLLGKAATDGTSGQMTPNSRRFLSYFADVYVGGKRVVKAAKESPDR
jgi:hypothetical protein